MRRNHTTPIGRWMSVAIGVAFLAAVGVALRPFAAGAQTRASAPDSTSPRPRIEFFGQIVADMIHDFNVNDPVWFDVVRPSRLPSFPDEFGEDGHQYFSVRPTRFGSRLTIPTDVGVVNGIFDWDLFGGGGSPGRTTFNLVRAYASLGKFGAGQYDSPFMDIDVFPNSIEYWGPAAIVFFRNIQFRWMPIRGNSRLTVALERPGASADRGDLDDHLDLSNIVGRFPWPDLSAQGRLGRPWGYVQLAGILRGIYWDDLAERDTFDFSGRALGWGFSLSSNVKTTKTDKLKLQILYGEAIEDYLEAPFDIGPRFNPGNPRRPIEGVPLPAFGGLAFYDHSWSDKLTTSLGWSGLRITNSNAQTPLAFHTGQYALLNLLYSPAAELMVGGELQWGRRGNAFDGFRSNDFRIQITARLNYSVTLTPDKDK